MLLLPAIVLWFPTHGHAQEIHLVTSIADSGPGSFREAVNNSNPNDGIYFTVGGTVQLNTPIDIFHGLQILGPSPIHLVLDGSNSGTILNFQGSALDSLLVAGVEFLNATNSAVVCDGGMAGFTQCVFKNNQGTHGGAIDCYSPLYIEACSFISNSANDGGAIYSFHDAGIVNSTFYSNTVTFDGGAVYMDSGLANIVNNTFVGNGAAGKAGALFCDTASVVLTSNLFYLNTSSNGADPSLAVNTGAIFSGNGNFMDSDVSMLTGIMTPGINDNIGTTLDPDIPTQPVYDGYGMAYFPIQSASSDAVDLFNTSPPTALDQRRGYRIMFGNSALAIDAGAVEYTPLCVTIPDGTPTNNGAPTGSLGWAIDQANASPSPTSICFNLSNGFTDIVTTGPYQIDAQTIIDGYTQPGSKVPGPSYPTAGTPVTPAHPVVSLKGLSPSGRCLVIQGGDGHIIRGLTIYNFDFAAITVENAVFGARIEGNHIGVDTSGLIATANLIGVRVAGGANHTLVGDWYYPSRNVISGSDSAGVRIQGLGCSNNLVYGNIIGLDAYGDNELPNHTGVAITDSATFNIVGDSLFYGNIISGNGFAGVLIQDTTADWNAVYGNLIGTDITGTQARPNQIGVLTAVRSNLNTIGGPGRGNLVSGNQGNGIEVRAWTNFVQSNIVGLDINGLNEIPNGGNGVHSVQSGFHVIGGNNPEEGNIIGGNGQDGVYMKNCIWSGIGGNLIGIGADTLTLVGNGRHGVMLDSGCIWNSIGGNSYDSYNIIADNDVHGIMMHETGGIMTIRGNHIGTFFDGTHFHTMGNAQDGIHIDQSGIFGSTIGDSTQFGLFNAIAHNGGRGIHLVNGTATAMYRNLFYENGNVAIDLASDGPTVNDSLDPDTGPNQLTNTPELFAAQACGNGVLVDGKMLGKANHRYFIEFYASQNLDPTGFGEGQLYLGATFDTTDATGVFYFNTFVGAAPAPAGWFVTATATVTTGATNTSEFCQGVSISSGSAPPTPPSDMVLCEDDSVVVSATGTGGFIVWALDSAFAFPLDTGSTLLLDSEPGSYTYYVAETFGVSSCLSQRDSFHVDVFPYDSVVMIYPAFCQGTSTGPASVSIPGGTYSFEPQPSDGASINASSGVITGETSGASYGVQYITASPCPDTALVQVTVLENPTVTIASVTNELCEGDGTGSITIQASGGLGQPYFYSIDSGATVQLTGVFPNLNSGTYLLAAADSNGCFGTVFGTVGADNLNTVDAGANVTTCPGETVTLTGTGTGTFLWVGPGVADSASATTTVTADTAAMYTLTVQTIDGCVFSDSVWIYLDSTGCDASIYNAFSPNGDGVNDTWSIPAVLGNAENRVIIYNRWGDVVRTFADYDNVSVAWDGSNQNGKPLPTGTYFFTVDLIAGDNRMSGWVQLTR